MNTYYFYVRQTTIPDIQRLFIVHAENVHEAAKAVRLAYGDEFWTTMQVFGPGCIDVEAIMTEDEVKAATEAGYDAACPCMSDIHKNMARRGN